MARSTSVVDRGAAQPRTGLCFERCRRLRPRVGPGTWQLLCARGADESSWFL